MKLYTCPMCCDLGFTCQKDLKEHLLKAADAVNCPACFKLCKNVLFLIKHLDQCTGPDDGETPDTSVNNSSTLFKDTDLDDSLSVDKLTSDNEDDDVEGYFCTVCDTKIPDVFKHIQQFHSGQEVILQDDDDDDDDSESSKPSSAQFNCSTELDESNQNNSGDDFSNKKDSKRKQDDIVNGKDVKNELYRKKIKKTNKEDDEECETYYCSKCEATFPSLTDHMKNFHNDYDIILKDLSITELFPESNSTNNSFTYFCSCCQKSFVRKSTLVKHLKLNTVKDKLKKKCCYKKKTDTQLENVVSLDNSLKLLKEEIDGENFDVNTEYEIEEVKPEGYELDELGHSIFNT